MSRTRGALEVPLERVETASQLGAVKVEPLVEFSKRFGAQAIQPTLSIATDLDEASVAQHLQVPGDARLMEARGIDELGDRTLAAPHHIEDPPASRLRDHLEYGEISVHFLNIHSLVYTCKWILGKVSATTLRDAELSVAVERRPRDDE